MKEDWIKVFLATFLMSRHDFIWSLRLFGYTLIRGFVQRKERILPIKLVKLARIIIYQIGGMAMAIEGISGDILLITLPEQPQNGNEIDLVNKMLGENVDHDVVMDFGKVRMLTSSTICSLMILDRLLRGGGRHFVMCNVPTEIKQIFTRTGLLSVFEFSDDQQVALQEIRSRRVSWAGT